MKINNQKVILKPEAKLRHHIKEYKKYAILTPITVIIEAFAEILIPLMMSDIINFIDEDSSPYYGVSGTQFYIFGGFSNLSGVQEAVTISAIIMILTSFIALIAGTISGYLASKCACGLSKNLRKGIYYKVQTFSFENIDTFSTASLITRSTTDVTNVQNAFMMIIRVAFRAPAMLIFSFAMAMTININIALTFLYIIPILVIGLGLMMYFANKSFSIMFKKYDRLNLVVEENVGAQRTVKSFDNEPHEINKFKDSSQDVYHYSVKAESVLAINNPLLQFTIDACVLIICFLGSYYIVNGTMNSGNMTALLAFIMQILGALMMISFIIVMVSMARASANRIREVLNAEPTITNPENPVMEVSDGSIEFKNVDFAYTGQDDLNKLNLEKINLKIKSGETLGIIGGTGSSKSTFVNLIPRLYDVTSGELFVGNKNVKEYDLKTLRDQVSVVLQKNVLFSGTIFSNLRWGNENASDEELIHAAKLAQADEFVSTFPDKYDSRIEQGGTNVSGGQRQRLCIARALVKKPKILILDDSTSAVDTKTDALIRKAFREEIPDTTKIIIAQRVSSVQDSDHIIVLDQGKIVGYGTHDELIKNNDIYNKIYVTQVKGVGSNNA